MSMTVLKTASFIVIVPGCLLPVRPTLVPRIQDKTGRDDHP